MSSRRFFMIVVTLLFLVGACTPSPSPTPTVPPPTANAYPAPGDTPLAQPPGAPYPYPLGPSTSAEPTRDPSHIPFRLNKPLTAGATQVTGTGPAGVPLSLQDVTFMGTLLAQTVIKPDNTFVFQLAAPLEAKHRLGIMVDNLAGTKFKPEDFYSPDYLGDESMQLPQVGFYYDTAMVQAKP